MGRKEHTSGLILGSVSAILYGIYPLIVKYTTQSGMNGATILFLRFLGCSAILWMICLSDRETKMKVSLKTAIQLLLVGMIAYAAMSALNIAAIQRISPSLASLLLCAYPVFVTLIYVVFGRENFAWRTFTSLAACVFGMYLLLDVKSGSLNFLGIIFGVAASISYASYIVIGSTVKGTVDPIMRATLTMSGSLITYTFSGMISKEIQFNFDPIGWLWIVVMILLTTVVPVMLFWMSISKIGAINASLIGVLEPISTVILSALLLHETMQWYQLIGATIVITSVLAIQLIQIQIKK